MIRECKPIYDDDPISIASLKGKIFLEQYRTMLLDVNPADGSKDTKKKS